MGARAARRVQRWRPAYVRGARAALARAAGPCESGSRAAQEAHDALPDGGALWRSRVLSSYCSVVARDHRNTNIY